MSSLGVVVFSLHGMKHLSECLESVQWADAVKVWQLDEVNDLDPIRDAGRVAQELKTEWLLHLWGEERVTAKLREELTVLCRTGPETTPSSYRIPVRSLILGRWVRGSLWGSFPSRRLWRKTARLPDSWWNRETRSNDLPWGSLNQWIEDLSCADLRDGVHHVNQISSLWAQQLELEGRNLSTLAISLNPFCVSMRLLLVHGLLFSGLPGLTLSGLASYATLVSGMKWWESCGSKSKP
ncbi:MAG: hypothetical protein GTO40_26460 [Deltaproteobacteria bacterium]|nr:hypothetical protein [Deltaproteobacteria bacterium]